MNSWGSSRVGMWKSAFSSTEALPRTTNFQYERVPRAFQGRSAGERRERPGRREARREAQPGGHGGRDLGQARRRQRAGFLAGGVGADGEQLVDALGQQQVQRPSP